MMSSGRLLCCISKNKPEFIFKILKTPNKYTNCSSVLSVENLKMMSTTQVPEMQDKDDIKHNMKFYNTNKNEKIHNTKINMKTHFSEKQLDFSQTDPDTFGNLQGNKLTVEETDGDEGDIEEEKYLEQPPRRSQKLTTKQYADMIKEFFRQKKVADAIDVLETRMLKEDRVKPENYIYNLIISELGRLGYSRKAFQLFNQMKKRDLKVTGATYTALFNACANSPWPHDGLQRAKHLRELIFEKGYEPNAHNYHAMIKAFGRCGDLSTAFTLVDEMAEKRLRISNETFNFLFQACITDKEAGFRHALLVWRKMINKGVRRNVYTYNLLLRSIRDCGLGDLDVTRDVFHKIVEESNRQIHDKKSKRPLLEAKYKTDVLTLESADEGNIAKESSENMESTTEISSVSEASITTDISENRPNLLAVSPQFGNIIALTEVTKPEDRLLLVGGCSGFLEQMKKDGVKPNIKTFTQLLDNIPSTKSAEKALLSAMERENVTPDIDFYNMLIKKRSMRFDYMLARDVLKLIQKAKLHPDIVTFGVLALGCQSQEEAQSLISDMRNIGFRMNAEILGAMLKQGCYNWNFDYVIAIMQTVIEEDVAPNEKFLEHLEKFHKLCSQKIKYKDTNIPGFPGGANNRNFWKGFKEFSTQYTSWLKQVEPEKIGHPWEQFQKKTKPDNKTTTKESRLNRNEMKEKVNNSL